MPKIEVKIHSVNPPLLEVLDNGKIDVSKGKSTIEWTLQGRASKGAFRPMDCANPGFSWVTDPAPTEPAGPFSVAKIGPDDNNTISVEDNNTSPGGPYIYMLRAMVGDVMYTTTAEIKGQAGVNNPIIINR